MVISSHPGTSRHLCECCRGVFWSKMRSRLLHRTADGSRRGAVAAGCHGLGGAGTGRLCSLSQELCGRLLLHGLPQGTHPASLPALSCPFLLNLSVAALPPDMDLARNASRPRRPAAGETERDRGTLPAKSPRVVLSTPVGVPAAEVSAALRSSGAHQPEIAICSKGDRTAHSESVSAATPIQQGMLQRS
jgi:hypothetical protein